MITLLTNLFSMLSLFLLFSYPQIKNQSMCNFINIETKLEGIKCKAEPLYIALHPNRHALVAGLVNGDIETHDHSKNEDN